MPRLLIIALAVQLVVPLGLLGLAVFACVRLWAYPMHRLSTRLALTAYDLFVPLLGPLSVLFLLERQRLAGASVALLPMWRLRLSVTTAVSLAVIVCALILIALSIHLLWATFPEEAYPEFLFPILLLIMTLGFVSYGLGLLLLTTQRQAFVSFSLIPNRWLLRRFLFLWTIRGVAFLAYCYSVLVLAFGMNIPPSQAIIDNALLSKVGELFPSVMSLAGLFLLGSALTVHICLRRFTSVPSGDVVS